MGRVEALALSGVLWMVGCSEVREPVEDTRECGTTWREDIQPLVAARCASCHSGALPAGEYSLESYLGALGTGTDDTPNVVRGEEGSRIVTALEPGQIVAHGNIPELEETQEAIRDWVVTCEASYFESDVHSGGILNPHDEDEWHGNLVENTYEWDLNVCAQCHGADFNGGPSGSACTNCHVEEGGPTACTTCHGLPPESGAHPGHALGRTSDKPVECQECHKVPAAWDDEGHIRVDGHADRGPAEIQFGAIANADPHGQRTAAPAYDPANKSCSNVYCHGGAFADTSNTLEQPTWQMAAAPIGCAACHGMPPKDHTDRGWNGYECTGCHGAVAGPNHEWASGGGRGIALHVNGQINLGIEGTGAETCNSCHGDSASAAPPRDLSGQTSTASLGVGAHRSHVLATGNITAPLRCSQCHPVISSIEDPDHLDGPFAELFPTTTDAVRIAFAQNADVTYTPDATRTEATCTNYCHGSGDNLLRDQTSTVNRTPGWTEVGQGLGSCGSCHGIPPRDGIHETIPNQPVTLNECQGCHYDTIDQFGAIKFTGSGADRTTKHINGVNDVVAAP